MLRAAVLIVVSCVSLYGQCPVEITKVNPSETQSFARVARSTSNKDLPPDFVVKLRNISGKGIRGVVFLAAAYDAVEDLHIIPTRWNAPVSIKASQEKALKWENFTYSDTASTGWVVIPTKILFEDGSKWEYTSDLKGCYGEYWRKAKHPRLTGLPDQLLQKLIEADPQ